MPGWDDYRYFLAVARAGSLSGGARALGVTQPTMGRRIEQLETSMRHALFERLPGGFALTQAGAAALPFAEQMERAAEGLESALSSHDEVQRPVVRITTTLSLSMHWLGERVAQFLKADPSLRVSTRSGISLHDVRHFHADIALRIGGPGEDSLFGRRVGSVHCGLYASMEYIRQHGAPASPEDLEGHRYIESEGEIEQLEQAHQLRALSRESAWDFCADNTVVQLAACKAGCGIAPLMCLVADQQPGLVRVLKDSFDVSLDLWLLTHRELRNDPAVRRVFDYLAGEAQSSAALFEGRAGPPAGATVVPYEVAGNTTSPRGRRPKRLATSA